jgi:hypothetical protein
LNADSQNSQYRPETGQPGIALLRQHPVQILSIDFRVAGDLRYAFPCFDDVPKRDQKCMPGIGVGRRQILGGKRQVIFQIVTQIGSVTAVSWHFRSSFLIISPADFNGLNTFGGAGCDVYGRNCEFDLEAFQLETTVRESGQLL